MVSLYLQVDLDGEHVEGGVDVPDDGEHDENVHHGPNQTDSRVVVRVEPGE